ncbi:hypothetical protein MMC13_001423 [Lambiella insularis]|nr:hypothetical protein [Lambiella insularis]
MVYPVQYPAREDIPLDEKNNSHENGDGSDLRHTITFSPTFGKVTASTFNRRRSNVVNYCSSGSALPQRSYIPTPHGAPLTAFNVLTTTSSKNSASQPVTTSEFAGNSLRTPSSRTVQKSFLTKNDSSPASLTPPTSTSRRRESSAKITQHQLMAPLPPPMPRSNTMGLLINDDSPRYSPKTPSFARPTSSSAAKHRDRVVSSEKRRLTINTPTAASLEKVRVERIPSKSWNRRIVSNGTNETKAPTSANATETKWLQDLGPSVEESTMPTAATPDEEALPIMTPRVNTLAPPSQIRRSSRPSLSSIKAGTARTESNTSSPLIELDSIEELEKLVKHTESTFVSPTLEFEELLDAHVTAGPSSPESELSRASTPTPENLNIRQVTTALSQQEWLGRVIGLSNRFRTEELNQSPSSNSPSYTSAQNSNHGMHNEDRRMRRVFIQLNSLCVTDEARASLAEFKVRYEARVALEEQWERGEKPRPQKENKKLAKHGKQKEEATVAPVVKKEIAEVKGGGVQKQLSVFERLMPRKKKPGRRSSAIGEEGPSD